MTKQECLDYYSELFQIQKDYPCLTFKSEGKRRWISDLTKEEIAARIRVSVIISKYGYRAVEFFNFEPLTPFYIKKGQTSVFVLRFDAMWDSRFKGINYVHVDQFKPAESAEETTEQLDEQPTLKEYGDMLTDVINTLKDPNE